MILRALVQMASDCPGHHISLVSSLESRSLVGLADQNFCIVSVALFLLLNMTFYDRK